MRKWKTSLCGCCDSQCGLCCLACVCPSITYYTNLSVMKESDIPSSIPTPSDCGNAFLPACIHGTTFYGGMIVGPAIYACTSASIANSTPCLFLVPCAMEWVTRDNIRAHDKIQGNCCEDCCTVLCCYSCALVQEMNQLDFTVKYPDQTNSMGGDENTPLTKVPITRVNSVKERK